MSKRKQNKMDFFKKKDKPINMQGKLRSEKHKRVIKSCTLISNY